MGSNLLKKTARIRSLLSTPLPSRSSFSLLIITSAPPSAPAAPPAAPPVCPCRRSTLRPAAAPPPSAYPTSHATHSPRRPALTPRRHLTSCAALPRALLRAPSSARPAPRGAHRDSLTPCSSPLKLVPMLDSWSDSCSRSLTVHPDGSRNGDDGTSCTTGAWSFPWAGGCLCRCRR
jgi:hypothetical protein